MLHLAIDNGEERVAVVRDEIFAVSIAFDLRDERLELFLIGQTALGRMLSGAVLLAPILDVDERRVALRQLCYGSRSPKSCQSVTMCSSRVGPYRSGRVAGGCYSHEGVLLPVVRARRKRVDNLQEVHVAAVV